MAQSKLFGDEYIQFLQKHISSARPVAGRREVLCRCFYCPDSRDPSHAHMYISVPQSEDEPSEFHCKKCNTGGYVTTNRLIEWGIYDPVIGTNLDIIMKNSIKKGIIKGTERNVYNFRNGVIDNELAAQKVAFINSRLDTNLTIQECIDLKIILNLGDTLMMNNIKELSRHPSIVQQLHDHFVGFLSEDNNFVNLRRICNEGIVYKSIDKRYINYNIFGKKDNTEKMYVIPTVVDLNNPYPLDIHIAEGPFDILSIYLNLRQRSHGIYCACGGGGYASVLDFIINTLKIYNPLNIHFYPDNDEVGNEKRIINIANFYRPYGYQVYSHRNYYPGEKDMGVPLSRIDEKVFKL
ncbi:MAG: hypothetical protein IKA36_07055 [Clostridia bacterium]|nr:hypothetical protein [Clostridia bacterium]